VSRPPRSSLDIGGRFGGIGASRESLIALLALAHRLHLLPSGLAQDGWDALADAAGAGLWLAQLAAGGVLLVMFETSIAKMRAFRVPGFLGAAVRLGLLAALPLFLSRSL
jgi:formate hydrogenlyase subunit 4